MPKTSDLSVFIIEDDLELGKIFLEIFQETGLDGELIRDGRVARERLATTAPDLVVLDLHIPEFSGLDILAYIRGEGRLAETRVVVMSADVPMIEMIEGQADAVLTKPASLDDFLGTINQLLDIVSDA